MLKCLRKQNRQKKAKELNLPRKRKFREEYLRLGVAEDAAIAAGYSRIHARKNAWQLAAEVELTLAKVARARGNNEHGLIKRWEKKLDAESPRWNPELKCWDHFPEHRIQLEAIRDLAEIIEPRVSQTTMAAALGHDKGGRPTLQIVLQHTMPRPDRSKQAVKTLNIPVNGSAHADDD